MNDNTPANMPLDGALRVMAIVLAIAMISIITFVPLSQNDFWLQAAIGRMIIDSGQIPRTVLFPFTWVRDNPFNAHEWLPSIAFYLLDKALGYERLLFVQGALGLAIFGLCFALAHRLSRSIALALLCACGAMVVANYRHFLRPEIFALLLLVAELQLLTVYRMRRDGRALFLALPIALIWANAHGSFVLGPVVAVLFALGEAGEAVGQRHHDPMRARLRAGLAIGMPYAMTAIAMILVSLMNPLGVELLRFAISLSGSEVTKTFIREWNPTFSSEFMVRPGFSIFMAAILVVSAIVFVCRRRLTVTDVLLLAAFLALGLMRSRYIVFFGFAALVVCARLMGAAPWSLKRERLALCVSVCTTAIGLLLALRFGNAYGAYPFYASSTAFTEPMVERLSDPAMQGNVFNSYELGAELVYRAYPRLRPSIDSRIDSYGDRYYLLQQQLFDDGPLLKDFVADFDVRYMLLMRRDFERVRKALDLKANWTFQFADHKAVLLARRPAEPRGAQAKELTRSAVAKAHGK